MKTQIVCLFGALALASAMPQGQPFRGFPTETQRIDTTEDVVSLDPSDTANIVGEFLPELASDLTTDEGTPMDRLRKITLAFLPLARKVIEVRGKNNNGYDTRRYLKQQEQAEAIVPGIIDSVAQLVNLAPTNATTPVTIPEFPEIPTFDNPNVSDEVLVPEIVIPASQFVPEIVIPEVKIS
ncbi:uncharacterized protein LOC125042764 [Penaeus chinensis]|uniref:uncharacterized protein LOC125042764 n=1 Tax=Penaeus chinensis TaxID=139456 RepID=UPI001FB63573|nr:uncharacterized protein LOC125042764 [Penaeus chinensis]